MSGDEQILKVEKEHRESEERYALIIKNSLDMIFTLDVEGIFLFLSPSFEQTMGYEISGMLGRNFRVFVHPEDVPLCETYLNDVVGTGQAKYGPEYRVSHASGGWRWHTVSGSAVHDGCGAFLYFIGVARDITERKLIEKALLTSYGRLEKLVRERTRELKTLIREQARELNQRKLIEAELESSHKHIRETTSHLQAAAENERRRTALEIYDDLSHMITSLQTDLVWLARQENVAVSSISSKIEDMRKTVQELDNRVKSIETAFSPPQITAQGPAESGSIVKPPHENLSVNEYLVMVNIILGKPVKQIAHEMGISPSTASTYRARLLKKMNMSSDAELIRYALQHGVNT
jgi:PAS domain S-box-containing protein